MIHRCSENSKGYPRAQWNYPRTDKFGREIFSPGQASASLWRRCGCRILYAGHRRSLSQSCSPHSPAKHEQSSRVQAGCWMELQRQLGGHCRCKAWSTMTTLAGLQDLIWPGLENVHLGLWLGKATHRFTHIHSAGQLRSTRKGNA